jgi:hypothetical protein
MIDATHPKYDVKLPDWVKIEDVTRAKNLAQYLVYLNPQDTSDDNKTRNRQYQERAIFYALSGQTVHGMVGSIFRKWPQFTKPDGMDYLETNADGAGVSIYQQSQGVTEDVIRKGRAGICVSFPQTEGQVSRRDLTSGRVVATIHRFEPEQIINWRTIRDGSKVKLSLVVLLEEQQEVKDDGYKTEFVTRIREMYLDYPRDKEGLPTSDTMIYNERIWDKSPGHWQIIEAYQPTDAAGRNWEEIPFTFIGAENNDPEPDHPPMLGIVELNIGHYRNSADYEDNVFYCGQAQPWMSGLTQDHIDLLKDNNLYVGSRNLIGVPEGEQFGFAQAQPNAQVKEAMQNKVDMMVSLGARMMQQGSATKTAAQVEGEREAQTSVLALAASNVSEAYTQAVAWACRYMGESTEEVEYTLNQEFLAITADPQTAQVMMQGFMQGSVPLPDYVAWMRRAGLFDEERGVEDYAELLGGSVE